MYLNIELAVAKQAVKHDEGRTGGGDRETLPLGVQEMLNGVHALAFVEGGGLAEEGRGSGGAEQRGRRKGDGGSVLCAAQL
ncbi:MAG: hypothetical protein DDT20_01757 [Firmicutes bacterium]|nr:hypothetical protein [Bacillota bacterium]